MPKGVLVPLPSDGVGACSVATRLAGPEAAHEASVAEQARRVACVRKEAAATYARTGSGAVALAGRGLVRIAATGGGETSRVAVTLPLPWSSCQVATRPQGATRAPTAGA